jgi:hypothetical protein
LVIDVLTLNLIACISPIMSVFMNMFFRLTNLNRLHRSPLNTQTHTPSPITILSNLTHSPLFTAQNTPHPASTSALPSLPIQTP